jgi:hypothetical protein
VADVSGMSRWRNAALSALARGLADCLNGCSARDYARIICTTRWAATEFEPGPGQRLGRYYLVIKSD